MQPIIDASHISMCFQMDPNRTNSLKEWFVSLLSGKRVRQDFYALNDVNFQVYPKEVVGIIGHNGSGKSTLLKVISGIYKPTSGSVTVGARIVPMLELGSGFDMELSGRENIFLNGAILGFTKEFLNQRYQSILEFSELDSFIDMPLKTYSSGMMMRLAFSVATVVEPEILIVDEILAVGDESFQRKSHARMLELMGGGTTVLFVSHGLEQIRTMCSRVVWLDHGKVRMVGGSDEVCDAYHCAML